VIHSRAAERRFYLAFVLLIFGAVLLGFGRTFFLRAWFPEWVDLHAPKEPYFLLHGTVATAWFITLIAQSSLVAAGRVDVHRRLGKLSMGLAAAVIVTGIAAAVIAARRPTGFIDIMDPPQVFLAIPLLGLLQYAVFVILAYRRRGNAQAHKRLMILATLSIIGAAVIRWPFDFLSGMSPVPGFAKFDLVALAFLLPLVAWDLATLKRLHPVTLYGGLALVAMVPIIGFVSRTGGWYALGDWIVGA
jgi:cytochrome bd-type quinol oxidase subunit 2